MRLPVAVGVLLVVVSMNARADAKEVARRTLSATVLVSSFDEDRHVIGLGSGFFVSPGVVLTNSHVIKGAASVLVRRVGKDELVVVEKVVWDDSSLDVAFLKVALDARCLSFRSSPVEIGESVYAAGNPEGLEGTFSQGIVSAVRLKGQLIQISAPISPGSSGGPVVDEKGKVVGVAVAQFRDGQNLNFAIPVTEIQARLVQDEKFLALWGPAPAVSEEPAVVATRESLSQSDIMDVVHSHKKELGDCVLRQRKSDPSVTGKILMKWTIQPSGRTSNVGVASEEFFGTPIAYCLGDLIKGMRFPQHRIQGDAILFPFKF